MTKIAVLGAGSWGTALANTAAENGHDVRLWTHHSDQAVEINQNKYKIFTRCNALRAVVCY